MSAEPHRARAIMLGDRYFVGWARDGRARTAWSLAGATLYLADPLSASGEAFERDIERLVAGRRRPNVVAIGWLP